MKGRKDIEENITRRIRKKSINKARKENEIKWEGGLGNVKVKRNEKWER